MARCTDPVHLRSVRCAVLSLQREASVPEGVANEWSALRLRIARGTPRDTHEDANGRGKCWNFSLSGDVYDFLNRSMGMLCAVQRSGLIDS